MKAFTRRQGLAALALALGTLGFAAGCRGKQAPPSPAREDRLTVFAAASLKEAFGSIAKEFEQARPGVRVSFNFAGSQELRTQLEHGAPADVFASADTKHMELLERAQRVEKAKIFAKNEPVIVVAPEASRAVRGIYDLPSLDRIVIGTQDVPIGRYTLKILDRASQSLGADFRARVEAKVVSRELNVKQVLAKVRLGEAQAGFVYRTDVGPADSALGVVAVAPEMNVVAEYPIARVVNAAHPTLAKAWVDWVLSEKGQAVLGKAGFLRVPADAAKP